jgi:hypothetical protein
VPLSPIDGLGWFGAIEDFSGDFRDRRPTERSPTSIKSDSFFEAIEAFTNSL